MSDVSRDLHIQGEAAKALLLNIKDVVADDTEMIETAIEGETNLKEAISSAVDRILELDAHEEALTVQIKALSERKERFAHQSERIKAAIHVAMGQAELRKLELPQATLGVRAVPVKCEIVDESLIPSKFFKPQDPKLDRKAILDALKNKEAVSGALLSNGGETLSLRVK